MSLVSKVSIVSEAIVRPMVLIVSVTMRSVAMGVSEMAVLSVVESVVAVMSETMSLTVIDIVSKAVVRVVMIIMSIAMIVSMMVASMIETDCKLVWIVAVVIKIVIAIMAKTVPVEGVVSIAMPVSMRTFMTKAKVRAMV